MPCSADPNKCCGVLLYNAGCRKCRTIAGVVRFFNRKGSVRFQPMSREEHVRYRAPAFFGDDGDLVVGLWPVARRCLWELAFQYLPPGKRWTLHGPGKVPLVYLRDWAPRDGNHCFVCGCVFGHCCNYCQATTRTSNTNNDVPVPVPQTSQFHWEVIA